MARVVIVGTEAESKCELQRQGLWRGERASSPGAPGRADPTSPRPSGKPLTKGLFPPSTTEAPVLAGSRPGEICCAHDDGGASARLGRKRLNFYAGQSCPLGPGRRRGPLSNADRAVVGADRRREIIYFSSCETSMSNGMSLRTSGPGPAWGSPRPGKRGAVRNGAAPLPITQGTSVGSLV